MPKEPTGSQVVSFLQRPRMVLGRTQKAENGQEYFKYISPGQRRTISSSVMQRILDYLKMLHVLRSAWLQVSADKKRTAYTASKPSCYLNELSSFAVFTNQIPILVKPSPAARHVFIGSLQGALCLVL